MTIPIHKIQGIRIMENLIRKPLGLATVYIEYAGGSMEDKESLSIMLFPLIRKKHLQGKILEILPVYETDTKMKPIPKRALSRYVFRKFLYLIRSSVPWYGFSDLGVIFPSCLYRWRFFGHTCNIEMQVGA
ncbi:PH domain-containing protein [[Brevibacterium] frigoritolerans]|uniref:PH domain-containing protein n=1 Tax=Peribacillus frigoritolerans TaxID=450367 RepID=A0A941FPB4_9BACI|nr:PH domain-containing protein [Peribacillus frigoritolerans]